MKISFLNSVIKNQFDRCLILVLVLSFAISFSCLAQPYNDNPDQRYVNLFTHASLKLSADNGKFHENGNSAVVWNSKLGLNIVVYTEEAPWMNNPDRHTLTEYPQYGHGPTGPGVSPGDPNYFDLYDQYADTVHHVVQNTRNGYFALGEGLEFVMKGGKLPQGNFSLTMDYLEVPLNVLYHFYAGSGSVFVGAGPYFAFAIAGTADTFGEDNGYKRFDAGANLILGYHSATGITVDAGYDYGITNIGYADQDIHSFNRTFKIEVGYALSKLFTKK